jgi:hypothetical protein
MVSTTTSREGAMADSQHDIDKRTLRALARNPLPTRVEILERDSLECLHDRDRLSGALERNAKAQERVAEVLEKPVPRRPWTARDYAVAMGGAGVMLTALGTTVSQVLKALGK